MMEIQLRTVVFSIDILTF